MHAVVPIHLFLGSYLPPIRELFADLFSLIKTALSEDLPMWVRMGKRNKKVLLFWKAELFLRVDFEVF
jgi:hypothetical protein